MNAHRELTDDERDAAAEDFYEGPRPEDPVTITVAELVELRRDKERLDWLDGDWGYGCRNPETGETWLELPWPQGMSIREAIDRAREGEGKA